MKHIESITILMASRNRLELLKKSLASALRHDYPKFEVLLVDDGSNHKTISWLKEIEKKEPNLRVIYQENQGVAKARQTGLENALYRYVCILDSDDLIQNGYLKAVNDYISINPNTALIFTNNTEFYESSNKTRISSYTYKNNKEFLSRIYTSLRVPFKHSGTILNVDKILQIGGYDKSLKIKIDIDLFLKVASSNLKIGIIPKPYIKFYFHKESISQKRIKGLKIWIFLINKYARGSHLYKFSLIIIRVGIELSKLLVTKVGIQLKKVQP